MANVTVHTWTQRDVIVRVGNYCSLANNIRFIIDGNHRTDTFSSYPFFRLYPEIQPNNYGKYTPVVGNDVWIGNDVTIYSGVTIGDGAVVAGQSVVTKSIPPYAIVGGNPAKIIRYRFEEDVIKDLVEVKWWNLPDEYIRNSLLPINSDIKEVIRRCRDYKSNI